MAAETILVTRPLGQGETLCQALQRAGFRACQLPLLQLEALPELSAAARRSVQGLAQYRRVIVVSGNAVHHGMPWIERYWPRLPPGPAWYAVGEATARALRAHGIQARTPGIDMTSEGLLALPELQAVSGERLLIIKGEGGRGALRADSVKPESKPRCSKPQRASAAVCSAIGAPSLPNTASLAVS